MPLHKVSTASTRWILFSSRWKQLGVLGTMFMLLRWLFCASSYDRKWVFINMLYMIFMYSFLHFQSPSKGLYEPTERTGHFKKSCPVYSLCIAIPSEQNRGERLQCCASLPISMITSFMRPLASHADVLKGWSRVPARERLLNRKINSFPIVHKYQLEITCRLWEIQSALLMSNRWQAKHVRTSSVECDTWPKIFAPDENLGDKRWLFVYFTL